MTAFAYTAAAQRVVFGAGAVASLADEVRGAGWQRVLLVTVPSLVRSGLASRVASVLGERCVAQFPDAAPHVPAAQVEAATALGAAHASDVVLALGGGSPIGLAKATAMALTAARGDVLVPSAAVPTTYAGSEMTPVYGVTRPQPDGSTRKVTVRDPRIPPRLVLYDPAVTLELPASLTASTGVNALAHGIEATYSRSANPLSTAAAFAAIRAIGESLPRCVAQPGDLVARTRLLEGAHLGGVALATVEMGLHHGTGHVLGGGAGVPHGVANCIVLPHAVRFNADACAAPLALVAEALGVTRDGRSDEAMALAAADHLQRFIAQLGQPQRLRDVGVTREQLPALADAMLASAAIAANPKPVGSHAAALAYLEGMW